MAKRMLIDATHAEETRVVVVNGNKLDELDFEIASKKQLKGNIYLAKVTRVEPSLQAAFVEYGGNRHGFLAFSEIHPDYYRIPVADREALLAQERDLEEREESAGGDVEMGDPRPGRNQRRSFRGGPRGDDNGGAGSHSGQDRPGQQNEPVAEEPQAGIPGAGEQPPYESGPAGQAPYQEPAPQPDIGDVPLDWFAPDEPAPEANPPEEPQSQDGAAQDSGNQDDGQDNGGNAGPDENGDGGDKPTTYQPANLPRDERSEPYEPSDSDAGHPSYDAPRFDAPVEAVIHPVPGSAPAAPAAELGAGTEPAVSEDASIEGGRHRSDSVEDRENTENDHEDDGSRRHRRADRSRNEAEGGSVDDLGGDEADDAQRRRPRPLRSYKIQEVIKRRQILLVQVVKEERGNKGAALTTYLSLPGRYCVLMPNTGRGGGISRKITNPQDRKRLKEMMSDLDIPEGMAVILRTAGMERTKPEIKRDLEYLLRLWDSIRDLTLQSSAPALIYEEANLIKRSIRDLYTNDIDEVHVEGENGFRVARDFMHMLMPSHTRKVQLYRDETIPLFFRYQVETQIDAIHSPVCQLKSGGYIVINQTEALVAIDVNSGRSTRERNIEETAHKTNLEAADEIARQLRLRDLAGLIVIDFIDMEDARNNASVERRIKEAMKNDRARIQVGRISPFGLLELSRQRLRPSLMETNFEKCPHCAGTGMIRSIESAALYVLRAIEEEGIRKRSSEITVHVATKIALYILNQKRDALADIERRYSFRVFLFGDDTLIPPEYRLERIKARQAGEEISPIINTERIFAETDRLLEREAEAEEDDAEDVPEPVAEVAEPAAPVAAATATSEQTDERGDRRRRRSRRRRRFDDRPEARTDEQGEEDRDETSEDQAEEGSEDLTPEQIEADASFEDDGEEGDEGEEGENGQAFETDANGLRKKRRRGKRGGRRRGRGRLDGEFDNGYAEDGEQPSEDGQPAPVAVEPASEAPPAAAEPVNVPVYIDDLGDPFEDLDLPPLHTPAEPQPESQPEPVAQQPPQVEKLEARPVPAPEPAPVPEPEPLPAAAETIEPASIEPVTVGEPAIPADVVAEVTAPEAAPEVPPAKPKAKRAPRKKKVVEPAAEAAPAPVVAEPAPEAPAAKPKAKRAPRKKKVVEPAAEAAPAPVAAEPAPAEPAPSEQIPEPVPAPLPQEPSAGDDLFMDVAPGPVEPAPEPDLPPESEQAAEPAAENQEDPESQPAAPPRRGWWSRG
ncbi:ribonuclease E [Skermanella aerolata]|uniref:Rne/Rng family ribonuclease n=1 Tax=Skermanella aerolata TaxID=393310 RepID=UPI003D1F08A2